MICVSPWFCFLAALFLLTVPMDWCVSFFCAALFHEFCHLFVLKLLRGKILAIHIQGSGCVIETGRAGEWQQFFSILAGPLGSFSLLCFSRFLPKIAVCGLLQGIYNLIPVIPLDGGRLLRLLLQRFCPSRSERILDGIAAGFGILFLLLAIWGFTKSDWEPFSVVPAIFLAIRLSTRKIPCKPFRFRVQ